MAKKSKKKQEKILNFSVHNRFEIIKYYFEGNLEKFLKRHMRQIHFQFTYIRTYRKWKKKKKTRAAWRIIQRRCNKLPGEVNSVVNIMITMSKYYDWDIDKNNAELCCNIHWCLREEIGKYTNTYLSTLPKRKLSKWIYVDKKKAIKEQKARGFIHIDDFDGYDEDFAHVVSIADYSLIYPKNILRTPFTLKERIKAQKMPEKNLIFDSTYRGLSSIGVAGHTKLQQPQKYVQ